MCISNGVPGIRSRRTLLSGENKDIFRKTGIVRQEDGVYAEFQVCGHDSS